MDRDRLQQVHQTDLTESQVNQDFVDWLKTKGMTWLLAILVGLCAYTFFVRYKAKGQIKQAEAWTQLQDAALPLSKMDVATDYADVFSVPLVARLQAAEQLMGTIQSGRSIDASVTPDPTTGQVPPAALLTDEERASNIERAKTCYDDILTEIEANRGSWPEMETSIFAVSAHHGLAAIAESLGNTDEARAQYDLAIAACEQWYPALAERSRHRRDSLDRLRTITELKSRAEQPAADPAREDRTPVFLDPTIRDLITPPEAAPIELGG